jgi:hypothetical protein
MPEPTGEPTANERRWATIRIALGQTQMVGAIVTACLLVATGFSSLTIVDFVVTVVALVTSRLLFFRAGGRQGGPTS